MHSDERQRPANPFAMAGPGLAVSAYGTSAASMISFQGGTQAGCVSAHGWAGHGSRNGR
eukprot:COSAG02_NODE_28158_length_595_cov_0.715726_1_plen_58_part_10